MYQALHPFLPKLIDVEEYKEFVLCEGFLKASDAPKARCPVCKSAMGIRARNSKDNAHFFHLDNNYCPTKEPAAVPFHRLKPGKLDHNAIKKNRSFVLEVLEKIYGRLYDLVPFFDFKEFITILEEANKLNCYAYSKLKPEFIPYIFVMLINYLPKNGKTNSKTGERRRLKFCFFYDCNIANFDDLWINQGSFSGLVRISFDGAQTTRVKLVDTSDAYLLEHGKPLSKKQMEWCTKLIER